MDDDVEALPLVQLHLHPSPHCHTLVPFPFSQKHKEKLLQMTKKERRMYEKKLAGQDDDDSALKEERIKEVRVSLRVCFCILYRNHPPLIYGSNQAIEELSAKERDAERILAMDERKRPYPLHTCTRTHTCAHTYAPLPTTPPVLHPLPPTLHDWSILNCGSRTIQ